MYGGFWISYGLIFWPGSGILAAYTGAAASQLPSALGIYVSVEWMASAVADWMTVDYVDGYYVFAVFGDVPLVGRSVQCIFLPGVDVYDAGDF